MKVIALHLPQFHRIEENDRWWGDGFTEWTNVKKATSLYSGHHQPNQPFQGKYYDLSDPDVRKWQAETAKHHGVYGFCYYHYWFKGKRLLEKPVNEILNSGEPDFPFCLSWANETWTRKWDGQESDILMAQNYGDREDWEEHFNYLVKVFKDKRYIRVGGKPLFLIYRPASIPQCEEMIQFWRELALKHGLKGIHFVQTIGGFPTFNRQVFDASMEFEPHYTFAHGHMNGIWIQMNIKGQQHIAVNYDKVWSSILERTPHRNGEIVYPGAFVNWDNTPRRGVDGQSTLGSTPEKFGLYLSRQMERARTLYKSEYLFVNAWNEWAEGAYLEPDQNYGYAYLRELKKVTQHEQLNRNKSIRGSSE
ncbi:glycoside hydrolase family 99-like domain-containing protein [Paenibacillus sp. FSL M8-0212]|uniref:glycosyltransferase WbsX family protein n=1 Tax=Paenibacillus sp. FSL M8-0212 TaxID=2921618 RepID=UPI0030F878AF